MYRSQRQAGNAVHREQLAGLHLHRCVAGCALVAVSDFEVASTPAQIKINQNKTVERLVEGRVGYDYHFTVSQNA